MSNILTPAADSSSPEPDLSGKRLGGYQILRRLGRGGMAEVYLAEQTTLRRQVAIKVLKQDLAGQDSYVRRFHHEAQAVASLVHANIVQIYEVGCHDGVHFIAQEYVPGQNLRQLLSKRGSLDATLVTAILRQCAAALHKASQQGIVHRDIKPENILIAPNGEVKVADFGLARVGANGDGLALTQVGVTLGTPLYMSPEQVEGKVLDPRSDLYSLGVTAYHMLAGRPPFDGETALAVAVQHLKREPLPLEQCRPDLPPVLCQIVHKLLAKEPEDRHQSPAELLRDLRALPASSGEDPALHADDLDATSAFGNLEVTRQLDALMKEKPPEGNPVGGISTWILLLAIAFVAGGLIAWRNRERDFLSAPVAIESTRIERKETPEAQYFYATVLNTEAGWRSVYEYFPPEPGPAGARKRLYAYYAKQQLARHYLQRDDLDKADKIFTELANLEPTEEAFRAFGLAGQALVRHARGEKEALAEKLSQLSKLRDKLDLGMRSEIDRIAPNPSGPRP